ncbi:rod shape-determining protein MreC [Candidatus Azambacteria bacterium]|nr:rod shape-determining protein MreC [Candidatus Azambacteria bacterium]
MRKTFLITIIIVFILVLFDVYKLDFFIKDFYSSKVVKLKESLFGLGVKFSNTFNFNNENKLLEKENSNLVSEIVNLKSKIKELELIEGVKKMEVSKNYKFIETKIISHDSLLSPSYLMLNKGSDSGLEDGLAVIDSNNFLIGRIIKTYKNSSMVDLVYNFSSPLSVRLLHSGISALVEHGNNSSFIVDLIEKNIKVEVGEIVLTTGNSQIDGLILGKIYKIVEGDIFNSAYGNFSTDFKNNYEVFVIKK